jgi:hypothetical protein
VYKKGTELPADYLSRNVFEVIRMCDKDLAEKQNTDRSLMHDNEKHPKRSTNSTKIQKIFHKPAEKLALHASSQMSYCEPE